MTEFGMVTKTEEKHVFFPSHGEQLQLPQSLANPYLRLNGLTGSDDIWRDSTCGVEACFKGQPRRSARETKAQRPPPQKKKNPYVFKMV